MKYQLALGAAALRRARQIRQKGKAIINATSAHTAKVMELPHRMLLSLIHI